jgi:type III secretion protein J
MGGGWARMARLGTVVLALLFVLALSACKEEIYSGLAERDANEMLALLLRNGITASKSSGKDGAVTLEVEQRQLADAIELLRTHGFPREQYDNVGQVFQKQGLVSSPTEDRVRLVYALSQELNDTLSRIDGVLSARVHVVMPEQPSNGAAVTPSSAAVFIRYQDTYDLAQLVPQIKTLVSNSIQDLAYDRVSVALFPVQIALPQPPGLAPDYVRVAHLEVAPASREPLLIALVTLGGLLVLLLVSNVATYLLMRRRPTVPQRGRTT